MTNQITNELRNANIRIEGNLVSKIEENILFVKDLGIEWFE